MLVSPLGLGTVKFGRNQKVKYPQAFTLPTLTQLRGLLNLAQECGINLLDTAPAYGNSEVILGKLLVGQRTDWIISTKVGEEFVDGESRFDFSEQAVTASVERSLARLKTDYLDIVLVHSDGHDSKIINSYGVFDTLARLKQAGKIRAFGMSTKTVAGGKLTVAQADVVMVMHHPEYDGEIEVLIAARTQAKGVLIKKAFASGWGNFSPAESIGFNLQVPAVSSIIIGTLNPYHLRANVNAVSLVK